MKQWAVPQRFKLAFLFLLLTVAPVSNLAGPAQQFGPTTSRPHESEAESEIDRLELKTSDPKLAAAFRWARQQASAYAFSGDPVGDWYEAALPGREAFCMRDVSHQSMGAQALGLGHHSLNMFRAFATNISESKDWCSYWEINRFGRPAPVDYESDAKFWYDLPANFDVLDACYRMYLWSGDLTYLEDPRFLNFYDRTVSDYVERWELDVEHVLKRERLMNIRGMFNSHDKFQMSRGIPGYEEAQNAYVVGVDLLASEYAGYLDYSQIQALRGNFEVAEVYAGKARELRKFVNKAWWNEKTNQFYSSLDANHQLQGHNGIDVLYYGVADDGPQAEGAVSDLAATVRANPSGPVELESHYPETLYRYGMPNLAYSEIMDLTRSGRYRQEYPEVSFSVVGAIVTGLMGISVEAPSPDQSAAQWDFLKAAAMTRSALLLGIAAPVQWNYVEVVIKTLPSLTNDTAWAEIRNLPIRANRVSIKHEGNQKTSFTNQAGPAVIWQAAFPGSYKNLLVNGQPIKASMGQEHSGRAGSSVQVPVGAGDTVIVEASASAGHH